MNKIFIYAHPCVNKDFVDSGSIGLIWGKHARCYKNNLLCIIHLITITCALRNEYVSGNFTFRIRKVDVIALNRCKKASVLGTEHQTKQKKKLNK